MRSLRSVLTFAALICAGFGAPAFGQEKVRVSVPQHGLWDTGVAELGQRAGIFKRHGLELVAPLTKEQVEEFIKIQPRP